MHDPFEEIDRRLMWFMIAQLCAWVAGVASAPLWALTIAYAATGGQFILLVLAIISALRSRP
jgi:hypothetical protein